MLRIPFRVLCLITLFPILSFGQQVNQRRPNLPSEEQIPEDVKLVKAPKSKSSKKPSAPGATPESQPPAKAASSPVVTPSLEPDAPPLTPPPLPTGSSLSAGEILASVFHVLKLPPPFETASLPLAAPARILICDPNAYTGSLSSWEGTLTWINKGRLTKEESVSARNGWVIVQWPTAEIGPPDQGTLTIKASRPVIALESLWSDYMLFGTDIPKLLVKVAPDWSRSPRRLTINRFGYREAILPSTLQEAIHHPQVCAVLKPFLIRAGKSEEEIKKLEEGATR